ncbi:MAG: type II secretion system protein GspE, partial [Candidatus Omnitrophica bacterium]|nr:type II secretion system protein GspE [Candidatus Omnitrophota bacterium]
VKQKRVKERLGEILVKSGTISEKHLQRALEFQKSEGGLLGEILIKLGYVNERNIVEALTEQYGFPYLPLKNVDINNEAIKLVPENVARQYKLMPVDLIGEILTLALSNPLNNSAIEDVEMITKKRTQVFISTISDINEAIKKAYGKTSG